MVENQMMTNILKRHYLVTLSEEGREEAVKNISTADGKIFQSINNGLPAIVRRGEGIGVNEVAIGFVLPELQDGRRMRYSSKVHRSEILTVITPYEVLSLNDKIFRNLPCFEALAEIEIVAKRSSVHFGVWGSMAMEIVTGKEYCHESSDVDILLPELPTGELLKIYQFLQMVEDIYGVRVDAEIDMMNGYGVSLKEFFSQSKSMLGKGIDSVKLIKKVP